jgi:hypothetical protein
MMFPCRAAFWKKASVEVETSEASHETTVLSNPCDPNQLFCPNIYNCHRAVACERQGAEAFMTAASEVEEASAAIAPSPA